MLSYAISFNILFVTQLRSVLTILGGHDVSISEVPHQVSYGDVCGGALIHKRWALTTAHCGKHDFLRIGSRYRFKGAKVGIASHYVHPRYRMEHDFDYDIQLLMMKRNLLLRRSVDAISLCGGNCGMEVLVSGWGYPVERGDYKDVLQQVHLRIVFFEDCQRVEEFWYNHTLTSRMFCAGGHGRDACQGDSGGGAVSPDGLVGLSSFGVGCGRYPGVYVNTSHQDIRTWIRRYTGI